MYKKRYTEYKLKQKDPVTVVACMHVKKVKNQQLVADNCDQILVDEADVSMLMSELQQ